MNEHVVPKENPVAKTTSELVASGMAKYASAELALLRAQKAMLSIANFYYPAFSNGSVAGGEAIKANATAVLIAGKIAEIRALVINAHATDTQRAKDAGVDVVGQYAELPPLSPDVVVTQSVGR
jgi:hypothetical protein